MGDGAGGSGGIQGRGLGLECSAQLLHQDAPVAQALQSLQKEPWDRAREGSRLALEKGSCLHTRLPVLYCAQRDPKFNENN